MVALLTADDLDAEPEGAGRDIDEELEAQLQDPIASNDEWAFEQADRMLKRLPRMEGKDRRTEGEVFDHSTLMTLHKLLTHGVLRSLDFPISTGKEANVFRGTTPTGGFVAVKIYRVNTSTFKHVLQYIQGDERFMGVSGDKRALVHAWAQKEFRNLHRMRDAGISVPEPIRVLQNVLVTEYIGLEDGPWPTLKDMGRIERAQAQEFWDGLLDDYQRMLSKAKLVHGDLSEYNILVEGAGTDQARARIIDVGQAVLTSHPMAYEFLTRDATNLTKYFRRMRADADPMDITRHFDPESGGEEE